MKKKLIVLFAVIIVLLAMWIAYMLLLAPTKILVVNAADAQQADFILNNDSRHPPRQVGKAHSGTVLLPWQSEPVQSHGIYANPWSH